MSVSYPFKDETWLDVVVITIGAVLGVCSIISIIAHVLHSLINYLVGG